MLLSVRRHETEPVVLARDVVRSSATVRSPSLTIHRDREPGPASASARSTSMGVCRAIDRGPPHRHAVVGHLRFEPRDDDRRRYVERRSPRRLIVRRVSGDHAVTLSSAV